MFRNFIVRLRNNLHKIHQHHRSIDSIYGKMVDNDDDGSIDSMTVHIDGYMEFYSGVGYELKAKWILGSRHRRYCCAMDQPSGLPDFPVVLFLDKPIAGCRIPQMPTRQAGHF